MTWGAWDECSQTCGGRGEQSRFRLCISYNESSYNDTLVVMDSCIGTDSQSRLCNEFPCLGIVLLRIVLLL